MIFWMLEIMSLCLENLSRRCVFAWSKKGTQIALRKYSSGVDPGTLLRFFCAFAWLGIAKGPPILLSIFELSVNIVSNSLSACSCMSSRTWTTSSTWSHAEARSQLTPCRYLHKDSVIKNTFSMVLSVRTNCPLTTTVRSPRVVQEHGLLECKFL